jgi:hypothetical protein
VRSGYLATISFIPGSKKVASTSPSPFHLICVRIGRGSTITVHHVAVYLELEKDIVSDRESSSDFMSSPTRTRMNTPRQP